MSDPLLWAIFGAGIGIVALAFFVLLMRGRRAADERFAAVMEEVTTRMDRAVRDLQAAVDRTHDDDQRARILGELAGTIDLDEVLARVLEAAGAIRGVDAALVTVASVGGEKPIVATVGLSPEEAETQALAGPPDGRAASMTISYDYPPGAAAINDRIGHLAGDGVLAEVAERVRTVVRSADIACRVGGDEFGIILPESTLADAEQLSHRMQAAVASEPIGDAGTLQLSAGAAELQPEDDATRFFERADDALYRAKESGKAEVVAAGPSAAPPFADEGIGGRTIGPVG